MRILLRPPVLKRLFCKALPLAFCLFFLFPAAGEAHAILLRSDPQQGAVLTTAPTVVRMWFTESLNPTFSTARVLNSSQQRVDKNNIQIAANNQTEMDVYLPPKLPPAVYIVIWRSQSANDGFILTGSFIFTVANPDGSIQKLSGTVPVQNQLGDSSSAAMGQLDGPTLFSLIMITLVELGTVFWVGAQLWRSFVIQASDETNVREQPSILASAEHHFDRLYSIPTLLLIFFANIGVLLGQAMTLTGGQLAPAFSSSLLPNLIGGIFGFYWIMREVVVVLALLLTAYMLVIKNHTKLFKEIFSWAELLLGMALLIALTLSGHAAAVSGNLATFAVLSDWLHLLAASLWIGGMLYIATTYIPVLMREAAKERIESLLAVLPRYALLAIVGIVIMAVTGPFNASTHMTSFGQLLATAYGRVLIIKSLLVACLLLISTWHIFVLLPRLAKDYKNYRGSSEVEPTGTSSDSSIATLTVQPIKGQSVEMQGRRIINTLRWETLLGIAVLFCTGLLAVFSGTLVPASQAQQSVVTAIPTVSAHPFTATQKTTDSKFTLTFNVTPNHFGENEFTVGVVDSKGQPDASVSVSLYNTMEDMDMGTRHLSLLPIGKGIFKGNDLLDMSGHWQVRIDVRAPDGTTSHATINFTTPADS